MTRRFHGWWVALCLAGAFLASGVAQAQAGGYWNVADGDLAHRNWQKAETKITTAAFPGTFKFLWKIKLGNGPAKPGSFREPLLLPMLITHLGFKDMVLWAGSDTLYSVDADLGTMIWQKDFKVQSPRAEGACGGSNIQIVMEPPEVIHFGAHSAASAPPPPPSPSGQRRIGAPAGSSHWFVHYGIYVLTSDGYLHEQNLGTGLDFAPAVRFLPAAYADFSPLNMDGDVVYTATGGGCRSVPNAAWSIDLNTGDYVVNSYKTQKIRLSGLTGPAIGSDGTIYLATGAGPADLSAGVHANSVVALTAKELKVKDWYTLSDRGKGKVLNAGPVVLTYKDKELVAAPGEDGSIVLLDSRALGGPDHHTPLARTDKISKTANSAREGLASWQEKDGTVWVLASISGAVEPDIKFADTNGPAPHGSIIAFKVEETDGRTVLTPGWISRDLGNPAPPVIANGVVFALDGGNASTHATLYALDAVTGKELYSSGDAIETYTQMSGVSIGDGQLFLTTHDNTLYSFGIPMEH